MPSIHTITPLLGGNYFHIYNRGVNSGNLFFQTRNYDYFLKLLNHRIGSCSEILAYCLLPNHFHLLLRLAEIIELKDESGKTEKQITDETEIGVFVSEQFRRMFISYSQAINRQENRRGSLLERNFKRKLIEDQDHLEYLFFYIHHNPIKHGVANDFRNYFYSSYQNYQNKQSKFVNINHGLKLFDGLDNFVDFHNYFHSEKENLHLE